MNLQSLGNVQLQAGREALRLAIAEQGKSTPQAEDVVYNTGQLQTACENFESAAAAFKREGRTSDEAEARLGFAEAHLKTPLSEETCKVAEASCRAALALLDSSSDLPRSLQGYLVLAEALIAPIGYAQGGVEKEHRMDCILGILHAAEYLAAQQPDPLTRAQVDELSSRVLGDRFTGDRDRNLLDAIRVGQRALSTLLHESSAESLAKAASLQVHLGNCYMKLDGPRLRWLSAGLSAYEDGLSIVDLQRYPRLQRVLSGNVAMAKALIAQKDESLPEKEMMNRFVATFQVALDAGDVTAAEARAWEAMRWAWSLGQVPNVWIGETHKILGQLLLQQADAPQALGHFYCAVATLAAVSDHGDPRLPALLGGARQLLAEVMTQLGRSEQVGQASDQADHAFTTARSHCTLGRQLIVTDPKKARDEFEQAVGLFPYDPLALFYRGVSSLGLADPDAARRDFEAVLNLQPRNIAALANRAAIKTQTGDVDGALVDYDRALDIDPNNVVVLQNRATALAGVGSLEAAVTDLDRLISAHPGVIVAYSQRADYLKRLGRMEAAAADLMHLLDEIQDPTERGAIERRIVDLSSGLLT